MCLSQLLLRGALGTSLSSPLCVPCIRGEIDADRVVLILIETILTPSDLIFTAMGGDQSSPA